MTTFDDLMRRLGGIGGLGPEGLRGMSSGELERQMELQRGMQQQSDRDLAAQQAQYHAQYQQTSDLFRAAHGLPLQDEGKCLHGWYRPTCPACSDGMRQQSPKPAEPPVEYPGPFIPHPVPKGRGFFAADLIPLSSLLLAGVLVALMVL